MEAFGLNLRMCKIQKRFALTYHEQENKIFFKILREEQ